MPSPLDHPPLDLLDAIRELLRLLGDWELERSRSGDLVDTAALHCFDCETDVKHLDWPEHECGLG